MFSGPPDSYPHLLGDIGGTHARFAIIEDRNAPVSHIRTMLCANFRGPLEAIQNYLDLTRTAAPRNAAIGIANPVDGDFLHVTNNPWQFSIEQLRQSLNLLQLLFINDFAALALALPFLKTEEMEAIGGGMSRSGATLAVIGPGTGLGVAGLVPSPRGFIPIDGEGGHVNLAPYTDEELAVTHRLIRKYGHVSAERVLSGPGIVTLYDALAEVRGIRGSATSAPDITAIARSGSDELCVATLKMFCALLGSTAGDLALTLGAHGGVFIGGGIMPGMLEFARQSDFRQRFEDKGRFKDYLARIPTHVVTASHPALTGAAYALAQKLRSS